MARKQREEEAGAFHHVFARGVRKTPIFRDDRDRIGYLRMLASAIELKGWRCLSYCLMTNHMHLLLQTPEPNLGTGMQRFHGAYAQTFNRRYGLRGHVFESRYEARRIKTDAQLFVVARYIAHNPVEAGLCAAPEDWPWSSHGATVGGSGPPWLDTALLLDHFGSWGGDGLGSYAEFVARPDVLV